ncbi:type II toxin-antitoxin system RelE/ParE family toxin [Taurinivorans muris]|uniref:Type II toxin-antitoxin system RelE/ParE family toxin n=1 Tax=Taurinivorans muris TaxID=2787751 RepID=A0ABY5Y0F6_9BACT|nr:type II toxin-antitoxin system RelE/ParE family toxin [Desulfovibrionaceae bacterium LT0009]
MPYIVYWTPHALENLEQLYLFLSEKNKDAARTALKIIREKALLLENFPNAGRPSLDLEPEHRELLIPFGETGYVMLCQMGDNTLHILAIKHQKEVNYK